ncbi:hypothetical protein AB0A63_06090 [Lentzea sp. NPDC042327]|uniref:hypothetical protein n=1 Tax=Lentzea sp. NPDC042327 TaxID=3154801 RepID=UPI0033DBA402
MPRKRRPDVLKGLSGRLLADLGRVGRSRNHLGPGSVELALRVWTSWLASPARHRWMDETPWEWDHYPEEDPFSARNLLDAVACALPRTSARELRRRLDELDDLY